MEKQGMLKGNTILLYLLYIKDRIKVRSEYLAVCILISLTIFTYYPFISISNIGAADAQFYNYNLHDALMQLKNGVFPPYVGQSFFSPYGIPVIAAPYYLLLGQFLDLITFGKFSVNIIQHFTVVFSALAAALINYRIIRKSAQKLSWSALLIAYLFVASPAVMSLIYSMDMYLSFLSIPFISLVLYGFKSITEKEGISGSLYTAAALAMLWLAHPPIAGWITLLTAPIFIYLIFIEKKYALIKLVVFYGTFFLLALWQVLPTIIFDFQSFPLLESSYADVVIRNLRENIPDSFLPLSFGKSTLFFVQLGYSLLIIYVTAIVLITKYRSSNYQKILMILIIMVCLLLYPLPIVGEGLWSLVPDVIRRMTQYNPNQRLTVICAALIVFVSGMTLSKISEEGGRISKLSNLVLSLLFIWSFYQSLHFISLGNLGIKSNESIYYPKDSWTRPYNVELVPFYLPREYSKYLQVGTQEPRLKNRLLLPDGTPDDHFDNEKSLINSCLSQNGSRFEKLNHTLGTPVKLLPGEAINLAEVTFPESGNYIICFEVQSPQSTLILQLLDEVRRQRADIEVESYQEESVTTKKLALPYFNEVYPEEKQRNIRHVVQMYSRVAQNIEVKNINVIKYDPGKLPIVVEKYSPYRASVIPSEKHKYLEVNKLFLPGYIAYVNGKETAVLKSQGRSIKIPIGNDIQQIVELRYVGTPEIRWALFVSLATWLAILTYALLTFRTRIKNFSL